MKNLRYFVIAWLVPVAVLLGSCTQHDGNIEEWFGSWHLESIYIDGELDREYAANQEQDVRQIMISFQSGVFQMAYIGSSQIFGKWSYAGETLTLIADPNSVGYINPAYLNPFPTVMYFPANVYQLEITVTELNGRTMQWQHIDPAGRLITYNFRKYP